MLWFVEAALAGQVVNTTTGLGYPTIGDAVDDAISGDTLTISADLYTEQVVVDRDLTLLADPNTTLAGPVGVTDVVVIQNGVSATIDGLVILAAVNDDNQRPVHVAFGAGDVTLSNCGLVGLAPMDSGEEGGGVLAEEFGSLTLTDVVISASATGAAISALSTATLRPPITLERVTIEVPDPGLDAVLVDGTALSITDSSFGAMTGSAILATDTDLTVTRSTFCGVSDGVGAIVATSTYVLPYTGVLQNNVFSGAHDAYQTFLIDGDWVITNNAFLDTRGLRLDATNSAVATDNLFVGGEDGLTAFSKTYVDATYNYFDEVLYDITFSPYDKTNLVDAGDPLLLAYTADGDCGNDLISPIPVISPLIDAGDPAMVDLDGSRSDIGPSGGPAADPALFEDGDGDGVGYLHDCDDGDAANGAATTFYGDCDGDGEGDPLVSARTCAAYPDLAPPCGTWVTVGTDCDDEDDQVNTAATETCAAGDANCDGDPDLGAVDALTFFVDQDGDGFGGVTGSDCKEVPANGVPDGGDCDDADPTAFPGAADPCDGVDQSCDGEDGTPYNRTSWYPDLDHDGYGDPSAVEASCEPVPGYVTDGTDCDDGDDGVYPGKPEICDQRDQNCDQQVDEGLTCAEDSGSPKADPGCGCGTGGATGSAPWWLAAMLWRRRRAVG